MTIAAVERPLIGITSRPREDPENPNWTMTDDHYASSVADAGGIPVALPYFIPFGFEATALVPDIVRRLDGILFTGGGDIADGSFDGHAYAPESHSPISLTCPARDAFEWALMRACWDADVPVLGICRGMQVMNVTLGGTLVRDIKDYPTKTILHTRGDSPDSPVHHVRISETSHLAKILGFTSGEVNSLHHEAIYTQAPKGLVVAWAEDGTPEGLEFDEKTFFLGVQWHPEKIRTQPQLFSAFVDAAREHGAAERAAQKSSLQ